MPKGVNTFLTQGAYVWLGAMFLSSMSTGVVDIGAVLVGRVLPSVAFSAKQIALVSVALSAFVVSIALRNGIGPVAVREVSVSLPKWPTSLDGFTIIQLSDVHIGPILKRKWLAKVVERVNAQNPDMIVITGDLIDGPIAAFSEEVEPLANLRSAQGVFFVTGNHEFYANVEPWLTRLASLGLQILEGSRVAIESEAGGFDLLGIHDRSSRHFGDKYVVDVADIVEGRDTSRALIALAHQPASVSVLEGHGVDLQISGHTHGGQMWPLTAFVKLDQPYVAGLYQHQENMKVYVSRGTGFWGPPMRLFAPAEITKLVISREM